MKSVLASLLLVFVSFTGLAASVSSTNSIVAGLYPKHLADLIAEDVADGEDSDLRTQAWAPLTPQGDVIAAAYANGNFGEVSLLRISGGSGSVLAEFWTDAMGGADPAIDTLDLNNDGKLDFIVTFKCSQGRETDPWVFLFDGKSITSATPLRSDGFSAFVSPDAIDLDDDGVMEIMDACWPQGATSEDYCIYRLHSGMYQPAEEVVWDGLNGRAPSGQPVAKEENFLSNVSSATLLLVNGERGSARSAAVDVFLNGQRVISRDQLNETVQQVSVPVTLLTNDQPNTISSTVFGKPNSAIALVIYVANPQANSNAPATKK